MPADAEPRRGKRGGSGSRNPTTTDELIAMLKAEGCTIERGRRGGHARVILPGSSRVVQLPLTPHGGHRALLNTVAQFRRLGLKLVRE